MAAAWRQRDGWSRSTPVRPRAQLRLEMLENRLAPAAHLAAPALAHAPASSAVHGQTATLPTAQLGRTAQTAVLPGVPSFPISSTAAPSSLDLAFASMARMDGHADQASLFAPAGGSTPHTAVGVGGCLDAVFSAAAPDGVHRTSFWNTSDETPAPATDRPVPPPAKPPRSDQTPRHETPSIPPAPQSRIDTPKREHRRELAPQKCAQTLAGTSKSRAARPPALAAGLLPKAGPVYMLVFILLLSWQALEASFRMRKRDDGPLAWVRLWTKARPPLPQPHARGRPIFTAPRAPPRIRAPVWNGNRADRCVCPLLFQDDLLATDAWEVIA